MLSVFFKGFDQAESSDIHGFVGHAWDVKCPSILRLWISDVKTRCDFLRDDVGQFVRTTSLWPNHSIIVILVCCSTVCCIGGSLLLQPTLFFIFPSGIQLRNIGLIINNNRVQSCNFKYRDAHCRTIHGFRRNSFLNKLNRLKED